MRFGKRNTKLRTWRKERKQARKEFKRIAKNQRELEDKLYEYRTNIF